MTAVPRKKCLLLTFQTPRMPGGGGEVRSFYMTMAATEVFDVTLLNLGGPLGDTPVPRELRDRCSQVIEPKHESGRAAIAAKRGRIRHWIRFAITLLMPWKDDYRHFLEYLLHYGKAGSSADCGVAGWTFRLLSGFWMRVCHVPPMTCHMFSASWRKIETEAQKAVLATPFDLVWAEHTLGWPFVEKLLSVGKLKHAPVILSGHNIEYIVCQRQAHLTADPQLRAYSWNQARVMHRMEASAWRRASLIFQCSERDAHQTQQESDAAHIEVIPNGVNRQYFRRSQRAACAAVPTLLFTAGFGYQPNVEAVDWFIREVLPLIRQLIPNVCFMFAGAAADSILGRLLPSGDHDLSEVTCVSDPEDIRPCFESAWVYVVPLRCGGGSRLKILEAMSMRVPVVSTTVGAEGVPYEQGRHLLLADDASDFANAVVQLLGNEPLRGRLSAAAYEFSAEYDWTRLTNHTCSILQKKFA